MWRFLLLLLPLLFMAACAAPPVYRVTLETPSDCYRLDRVEGEKVYLKAHGRVCLPLLGRQTLELDPAILKVQIYLDNSFWMEQEVTPLSLPEQ